MRSEEEDSDACDRVVQVVQCQREASDCGMRRKGEGETPLRSDEEPVAVAPPLLCTLLVLVVSQSMLLR